MPNDERRKSGLYETRERCNEDFLCELDKSYEEYVLQYGTMMLQLDKALYGLDESAKVARLYI